MKLAKYIPRLILVKELYSDGKVSTFITLRRLNGREYLTKVLFFHIPCIVLAEVDPCSFRETKTVVY